MLDIFHKLLCISLTLERFYITQTGTTIKILTLPDSSPSVLFSPTLSMAGSEPFGKSAEDGCA